MEKATRTAIERATQKARALLEEDYGAQLEGTYDVLLSGEIPAKPGGHLSPRQALQRAAIVAAIEHRRANGMEPAAAVADYVRDAAFTTLNRFVALKMLEARDLVQECITRGEQSGGYIEFCGLAPGVAPLPDSAGYRLYVECLFDELSTEIKVLFDRRDPASILWPRRQAFETLLVLLNGDELKAVWGQDETVGWVYQYFNSGDERRAMREESQAPRNSRELAVRNQFFTPRYVVQFLVENTIGRTWVEMMEGATTLRDLEYLVRLTDMPSLREKKDPRDLRILDPASGSGHFLLYAFDLLEVIYREAWADPSAAACAKTGHALREDFPDDALLARAIPALILRHNLHGIDIDARCAQIAALALWMRAQRAYGNARIERAERPRIERINVVVAEPMPGDAALVEAFATTLHPPLLGDLFRGIANHMGLAGELGSLLRVEQELAATIKDARERFTSERTQPAPLLPGFALGPVQAELDLSGIDDDRFFEQAEERLLVALHAFGDSVAGWRGVRRRLFAEDSAQGIALLEMLRSKFDVVLMNPPFGDPASDTTVGELVDAANDIGGAFVLAARRRWAPEGCIGVLSSTTLWFKPTLAEWRRSALLSSEQPLSLAAHLGGDVLDGASVSASAIVLTRAPSSQASWFIRLHMFQQKEPRLRSALAAIREGCADPLVFRVDPAQLLAHRGSPLAYWISTTLRARLASFPALEGVGAEVRQGVATADDGRFVRAWWEVAPESIGLGKPWAPFAKSSEYSPYWDDLTWVIRWAADGREVRAFERSYPRSTSYFGRAGVTYPARSVLGFNPRAFPADAAFGHMGSVAFPTEGSASALLGYLASRPLEYILSLSNGSLQGKKGSYPNHYEVGQIKDLPWPPWQAASVHTLANRGDALATAAMQLQVCDETTHQYEGLTADSAAGSVQEVAAARLMHKAEQVARVTAARAELDDVVAAELGFDSRDLEEMEREFASTERPTSGPWCPVSGPLSDEMVLDEAHALASAVFGVSIGRFDVRGVSLGAPVAKRTSAFDPLPAGPAALLDRVPNPYPLDVPLDGLMAADAGSPRDIGLAMSRALTAIWHESAPNLERDLASKLGCEELRGYFSGGGPSSFFARHIARYSKGLRSAPIYWQLGTPSARYAIWLYAHRIAEDTIFRVQNDFVAPRLSLEERRLDGLRAEIQLNPSAALRNDLAASETIVEDLRRMLAEVKRIAPLWKPDLDDGVVITMAPLWRLVPQHPAWQKELKSTWDALCNGDSEWAHLAMHLWPERVVPKCTEDRSFAIAHGLEQHLWVEDFNGRWRERCTPKEDYEHVLNHFKKAAKTKVLTDIEDFWRTAFRESQRADRQWWMDLEEGGHEKHPLALRLWPHRVLLAAWDDEALARAHDLRVPRAAAGDTVAQDRWLKAQMKKHPPALDALDLGLVTSFLNELNGEAGWAERWARLWSGDFDRTHRIALLARPAEVVPLAYADVAVARVHGLDRWFWIDDDEEDTRHVEAPADEVARAITARSSDAVKAALNDLLAAPITGTARGRGRSRRSAGGT